MSESIWQRESCNPGRAYMLGHEPYVKYEDQEAIVSKLADGLKSYIKTEPSVRLTLDTKLSNPERAVLAIPFKTDNHQVLINLARIIYHSLLGYYVSADPKTTHFGISNLLIEGNINSLLKREAERIIQQIPIRADIAGRVIQHIEIEGKRPVPEPGNTYLSETIRKGLDIHVGYRLFIAGDDINYSIAFVPLDTGKEIIEHIYYNLEQILQHNFIAYDENGENYLKINETLVFKELEAILQRVKTKELTRNKILNNLQWNTIEKRDTTTETETRLIGDGLYDFLNRIQDNKLKQATDSSRDLYSSYVHETANVFRELPDEFKSEEAIAEAAQAEKVEEVEEKPVRQRMTREQILAAEANQRQRPSRRPEGMRTAARRQGAQVPSPPDEDLRIPQPRQESEAQAESADQDKSPVPSR